MTDDHLKDLAAGDAVGALAPSDAERLREEIARRPKLAADSDEYRATVSTLEAAIVRERPGSDLFESILAEVESDASATPVDEGARARKAEPRWSWRRAVPAFVVGACAAAAVFAIALVLSSNGGLGAPDAKATVQGTPEFAAVEGQARLYGSAGSRGTLRLDLRNVPTPPAHEHYEVWVLRPAAGKAMEAVGAFTPSGSHVRLRLGLPGPGDYAAVDISVQRDGGPAEHSGTSLAGGRFEPST